MAEVVFINAFEVPRGREEAFLGLWTEMDDYMRSFPGYRWRRLYQALDTGAKLRYVNVAGWESAEHFDAAHDDGFRKLQQQEGWREFPALPSLYQPVREDVSA
jgi:heme-degrading monooxygenase HmoA